MADELDLARMGLHLAVVMRGIEKGWLKQPPDNAFEDTPQEEAMTEQAATPQPAALLTPTAAEPAPPPQEAPTPDDALPQSVHPVCEVIDTLADGRKLVALDATALEPLLNALGDAFDGVLPG